MDFRDHVLKSIQRCVFLVEGPAWSEMSDVDTEGFIRAAILQVRSNRRAEPRVTFVQRGMRERTSVPP